MDNRTIRRITRRVLLNAAHYVALNGHHQNGPVPDVDNLRLNTGHITRPMSLTGAVQAAASGIPGTESLLADLALQALARHLGAPRTMSCPRLAQEHVDAWNDQAGRSQEYAVDALTTAATNLDRLL